uniref:Uncharacterized protein n=1 Tax=Xiphophorus couchianus TaxID=32473 RepID=A0A3B5MED6_9TELE
PHIIYFTEHFLFNFHTSLELSGCDLERIPSAVFSLNNLQELDLKENKLCTVEEILSLQHCRRLVTLRLWHNKITYIPDHITKLHTLETLDISFNKLKKLPSRLFYCTRLRHLDISHNQITSIPSEVNILPGLQFFSAAFNSLESLPEELFSCKRIKTLVLSNNRLSYLSPKVGNLAQLVRLDIKGNQLDSLPLEIGECPLLRCTGLIRSGNVYCCLTTDVGMFQVGSWSQELHDIPVAFSYGDVDGEGAVLVLDVH